MVAERSTYEMADCCCRSHPLALIGLLSALADRDRRLRTKTTSERERTNGQEKTFEELKKQNNPTYPPVCTVPTGTY